MGFDLSSDQRDVTEKDLSYDYVLSENVAEDLVKYGRSGMVKNEEQFLLTTLGYLSGFMDDPSHYVSGVLIGTAGSGKSHLQNKVADLFHDEYLYEATSGSDTSIIYDDTWEDAYIASLDELQKPSDKIIEILKSLHGGEDEEFRYKVTGDGRGADRDVDEIVRSAIPYWFLYAQYEPDFEMWDRLLKVPVHESRDKNEGVLATQWDHTMVSFGNSDEEYMFDFSDGKKAIMDHIMEMPKDARVKIPAGEDEYGWNAVEHVKEIFDIDRSETNRVSGMVANLVRSSALLNYKNRELRQVKLPDGSVVDAYIAEPQDVANVLATRDTLLATTHELDRKKKAICLAIEESGGTKNQARIKDIQDHLRKTNSSFVKKSQITQMLNGLIDNHLVEKFEGAGKNGAHLYQFSGWNNLGTIDINDSFKEVFDGCTDPISREEFVESMRTQNQELTPSMADFMGDVEVSTDSESGQATLTSDESIELSKVEEAVRERLYDTLDGERIEGLEERDPTIKEMLGIVEIGEDEGDSVEIEGTILDPDNEIWYGEVGIEEQADAEDRVQRAMRELRTKGVFETSVLKMKGAEPSVMEINIMSDDEL